MAVEARRLVYLSVLPATLLVFSSIPGITSVPCALVPFLGSPGLYYVGYTVRMVCVGL